jgi:16S rRNA (cytosine967-C5)-methyltransferase
MISIRMLAYQILLHVEQNVSHPDRLLRTELERRPDLDARDRALLTELVYGVLRWRGRLDWHIDQLSRTRPDKIAPAVRVLLRLGLYQVLFLDRVPAHAAVDETVKIAAVTQPKHIKGFVNGLLRAARRRDPDWPWPDPEKEPSTYLSVTTSHPGWVVRAFLERLGFEETSELLKANNTVAPLVVRVNTLKAEPREVLQGLRAEGLEAQPSPWLEEALRVHGARRDVGGSAVFREGLVQIQDEASQLVGRLLGPRPGERVLDLCAGFGGKSTHLGILMENRGEVTAVEQTAWKLEECAENARRQGIDIVRTRAADVLKLDPAESGEFDRVLLDAPCTGFGSLRRNPDIRWRRAARDPYRFSRTQAALLQAAAGFVKKSGVLVYATCTLFSEENEDVAAEFEKAFPDWEQEPAAERLPAACRGMIEGPWFQSWPHRHDVDGFFAARWRRP